MRFQLKRGLTVFDSTVFASTRNYLASGVALVGAGAIALGPVQATLAPVTLGSASDYAHSVELMAAVNPITRALEVWENSETNLARLNTEFFKAPLPSIQQVIANQLYYMSALGSIDFAEIIDQMKTNAQAAFATLFAEDMSTLDGAHGFVYSGLELELPANLQPILAFTTTFTSGALIGLLGPVLAPVIALGDSLTAITSALFGDNANLQTAITELINIPANVIGAFLNGDRVLDLTPVLKMLNVLPSEVTGFGINLGGLLTKGGSLFNGLNIKLQADDQSVTYHGVPTGTIGSLLSLGGIVAEALGWSGTGNPLNPSIPVPGSGAAVASPAAAEMSSLVADEPAQIADVPEAEPEAAARVGSGKPSKNSDASTGESGTRRSADKAGSGHRGLGGSKRERATAGA